MSPHLSTRQYARIVESWVESIGLDPAPYGAHTMRSTKATDLSKNEEFERCPTLTRSHHYSLAPFFRPLSLQWHDRDESSHVTARRHAASAAIAHR